MATRQRVRDPVALTLAMAIGGLELGVALLIGWQPLWAIGAALVVAATVWSVSFVGGLNSRTAYPQPLSNPDSHTLVKAWREAVDDGLARPLADDSLRYAGRVVELRDTCQQRISELDDEQRKYLRDLDYYLQQAILPYQDDPPKRPVEWGNLRELLRQARDNLQEIADKLPERS